jgi:hypothetical protein
MPKDETPSGAGKAPKLSPFLGSLPHHERRFLKALALIIESGKAKTLEDLVKYCQQARETAAIDFIRNLAEQDLPVDLVFDAMCVHFRIVAHKRNNTLFGRCEGKIVGLLLPLPPHVLDTFLHLEKLTVLLPDHLHIPPNMERFQALLCHGTRPCRTKASDLEVIVFEAFREKDTFYFAPSSADIVDPRLLKDDVLAIVHLRPHRDPDDIAVPLPAEKLQIL